MAFQNGYNNNNGASQGGEKKKANFRVGRIYGADGILDVSVWNSDKGGVYTVMNIKSAIGKDPSTGATVYQNKMSCELPSVYMNLDLTRTFVECVKDKDPSTLNFTIDTKRGSKITVIGSPTDVKITIENQKNGGNATVSLDAIPVGSGSVQAKFNNLVDFVNVCFTKSLMNKLDPEEFAMVMPAAENTDNTGDVPF